MRDFLWSYFSLTGEIDAYLLLKEHEALKQKAQDDSGENGERYEPDV